MSGREEEEEKEEEEKEEKGRKKIYQVLVKSDMHNWQVFFGFFW